MHNPIRKNRQIRVLICVLVVMLVSAFLTVALENMSIRTHAESAVKINATCGMPTIDGNISTIEWSNAATLTVPMITSAPVPYTTTLYVMNSANYLYLGYTINDEEFSPRAEYLPEGDTFLTNFDNDLSGSIYELENNVLSLSAGVPQYEDRYIYNLPSSNQSDPEGGGTMDGIGVANRVDSLNHFEIEFPLCSGDTLDFCLHPTDVTGFRLEYLDAEADESFGGSHLFPGTTESSMAELVIGDCSTVPDQFIYLPMVRR